MWQVAGSPLGDKSRLSPLHMYTDTCIYTCMHTYTYIYLHTYLPHCRNGKGACITVQTADSTGILLFSETKPCPAGHIIQMNYERSSLVSVRKLKGDAIKLSSSYQQDDLIRPRTAQHSTAQHSAGSWKFCFERKSSHPQGCQCGRGNRQ